MWATEPEVRAAWERQQQNPQVYMAAEMIRQAGFPSAPPPAYGQQPYAQQPQQAQQQAYAPQGGPQYPFPPQQPAYGQPPQGQPQYPFQLSPAQQLPPQPVVAPSKVGGKQLAIGCALLLLGIAVTAGTHSAARHAGGGSYVIAYGPIVVGVITIFKGIFNLSMGR